MRRNARSPERNGLFGRRTIVMMTEAKYPAYPILAPGPRRSRPSEQTWAPCEAALERRGHARSRSPRRPGRAERMSRGFADAALWARIGSSTFQKGGKNEQEVAGNRPRNGCDGRGGARGPAGVLYWR